MVIKMDRDTSHDKFLLTSLIKKVKESPSEASLHVFFLFLNKIEYSVPVNVYTVDPNSDDIHDVRMFFEWFVTNKGKHILPVFFQETNMPPEFKEKHTFVRLKLEDLFNYIAQNENADGFIINPFSDVQLVDNKMYQVLKEVYYTEMKEDISEN